MAQRSYRSENFARVHFKRGTPEPSVSTSSTVSSSGSGRRPQPIGGSSTMASADEPQTASGQKRQQKSAVVTLEAPRPQNQRATNEYVETPFLNASGGSARPNNSGNPTAPATQPRSSVPKEDGIKRSDSCGATKSVDSKIQKEDQNAPIKPQQPKLPQQPQQDAQPLPPQQPPPPPPPQRGTQQQHKSIICPICHKCRCNACHVSGKIRGCSICGDHLYVNPTSCVEWLSCICCYRASVYHCYPREDETTTDLWMNNPCSCIPQDRVQRFSCISLCTLCLPCILCYWPLKALSDLFQWIYRKLFSKGCRCPRPPPRNGRHGR
ncbi:protein sprouty [Adelges cooleyi]|uniref:protein sprouty n=1 Tax=Adelges cooleyi TaxID=133065 RepID=UPI00217FD008|nr:protein sprouty [Adelges cooleyi]XP_050426175.1 protein sprouty [Adelges cooleyi]XP_050426176.1 protein sprouty [Adelges cooleyi]XP_050426178.1 protein sprouty [Adelges cooleyi]XP_050426179.1 protein sprouty [Adelges cooleyi]XP_050426180.1 protein sprouty [Adelges cooleyi]XP_050426181.1 protein sprouty [Adelges cooleyi]